MSGTSPPAIHLTSLPASRWKGSLNLTVPSYRTQLTPRRDEVYAARARQNTSRCVKESLVPPFCKLVPSNIGTIHSLPSKTADNTLSEVRHKVQRKLQVPPFSDPSETADPAPSMINPNEPDSSLDSKDADKKVKPKAKGVCIGLCLCLFACISSRHVCVPAVVLYVSCTGINEH